MIQMFCICHLLSVLIHFSSPNTTRTISASLKCHMSWNYHSNVKQKCAFKILSIYINKISSIHYILNYTVLNSELYISLNRLPVIHYYLVNYTHLNCQYIVYNTRVQYSFFKNALI